MVGRFWTQPIPSSCCSTSPLSLITCFSFVQEMPDVHKESPELSTSPQILLELGLSQLVLGAVPLSNEDSFPRQRKELMVTLRLRADVTKSSFSLSIFVVPALSFLYLFPYEVFFTFYCLISQIYLIFTIITFQLSTKQWPGNLWPLEISSGRLFCNSDQSQTSLCTQGLASSLMY